MEEVSTGLAACWVWAATLLSSVVPRPGRSLFKQGSSPARWKTVPCRSPHKAHRTWAASEKEAEVTVKAGPFAFTGTLKF